MNFFPPLLGQNKPTKCARSRQIILGNIIFSTGGTYRYIVYCTVLQSVKMAPPSGVVDEKKLRNELLSLVSDQLQIVTYKYFSRKFEIPFDVSKRILFQFLKDNGEVSWQHLAVALYPPAPTRAIVFFAGF